MEPNDLGVRDRVLRGRRGRRGLKRAEGAEGSASRVSLSMALGLGLRV